MEAKMNWFIVLLIIGLISTGITIYQIIKSKKKKEKRVVIVEQSYPNVILKDSDRRLYEQFMKEYDSGDFKFNDVGYRKGAVNTCSFGISEGFKYINNKMIWGYVRLHTGVDRARGGEIKGVKDVVQIPFNFDRSAIIEYKDNKGSFYGYGSLIVLDNLKYGFQMRIAHMHPTKDIIPWSYDRLKKGLGFERGWLLGSAGTAGDSSGAHTHTEFLSLDDSCEVFDILLEEQYKDKPLIEYTKAEVVKEYKKYEQFKNATDTVILKDWAAVKADRGASFANKYKYKFKAADGKWYTRYSSELLFNGL